ncbi:MAG: DEAD/DEAH box helicase [Alphaproteobacteria bacterium]
MKTFLEMNLPESLTHTLKHIGFNEPTPIQAQTVPVALKGQDVLGSAQTGTGKTAAFGIPMIAELLSNKDSNALVMTPTRELAKQVMDQMQAMLGKKSKIKTALLIGGEAMPRQFQQLRNNPRLVIGTPGRINDHLNRKSLKLSKTNFLVLDETDRMLDMGFSIQIKEIIEYMPKTRQTLLFSATLPHKITKIAEQYLNNPARISVASNCAIAENIEQRMVKVNDSEKYNTLLNTLVDKKETVIIFVKTKFGADRLAKKLSQQGQSSQSIHGDLKQSKRERVIKDFRNKKYNVLVATDVAARGLDIPHIKLVINYDLPQCPEDYIHRIGRTARAGKEGKALNLVAPTDRGKWNAIERLIDPTKRSKNDNDSKNSRNFKFKKKRYSSQNRRKPNFRTGASKAQ